MISRLSGAFLTAVRAAAAGSQIHVRSSDCLEISDEWFARLYRPRPRRRPKFFCGLTVLESDTLPSDVALFGPPGRVRALPLVPGLEAQEAAKAVDARLPPPPPRATALVSCPQSAPLRPKLCTHPPCGTRLVWECHTRLWTCPACSRTYGRAAR